MSYNVVETSQKYPLGSINDESNVSYFSIVPAHKITALVHDSKMLE